MRLQQGDYDRETVFGEDPAAMARHWADQGARHLHLVDLDGARSGQIENWASITAILKAVSIPCELGGGVRDRQTIARLLDLGMTRVVVGTRALKDPKWFREMCQKFPDQVALGIDARGGRVATSGWLDTSEKHAIDVAQTFAGEPLAAIIYTDIESDGMLAGPNFAALEQMAASVEVPVIASAVGGLTEVVRHEKTGILLAELSAGHIAEAVGRLVRESHLRQRLIDEAEVFSRKFDGQEQLTQITDIYEKLSP